MSINQSNFIWNTLAGLVNASEAVILLMIVGRTNGLEDAGIITLAFAVGNLMLTIGRYGVRNYQVTDINETFSFSAYFTHRICTVVLMGVAVFAYLFYSYTCKHDSIHKICVVFLICIIYMVEAMEDVFWGLYQKNGRLDIGAKIFIGRWSFHLLVTAMGLIFTKQVIWSLGLGCLTGAIFSMVANKKVMPHFFSGKFFCSDSIYQIFYRCFPLFLTAFLTNYVSNAPKYAIDQWMSEADQACYGYLAMPVFVVMLFSSFVYQPLLTKIAEEWKEQNVLALKKRIQQISFIILCLTVVCLLGAYICGIPALSALYAVDLTAYQTELLIIMIAGGFLAIVSFETTLLTVMRRQKITMIGYLLIAILAKLCLGCVVRKYELLGAASMYGLLMGLLTIFYSVYIHHILFQNRKNVL